MIRVAYSTVAFSLMVMLAGCGATCESVQEEIEQIGQEIQQNPETALDRAAELEELRNQLEEMGCLG